MSLSAVLTAQNIPVIDWSKTILDNVLLQGDKMYLKALNSGLTVLDPGIEFLSVDNLPKLVSVEPFEAQNNPELPMVVENTELPVEVGNTELYP